MKLKKQRPVRLVQLLSLRHTLVAQLISSDGVEARQPSNGLAGFESN